MCQFMLNGGSVSPEFVSTADGGDSQDCQHVCPAQVSESEMEEQVIVQETEFDQKGKQCRSTGTPLVHLCKGGTIAKKLDIHFEWCADATIMREP